METKIISPKKDIAFKALFGQNEDILAGFISDTLSIPLNEITNLKVLNPEIVPKQPDGKLTRLDIKLTAGNKNIDIEMQVAKEEDYKERILCYWANMYSENSRSGYPYLTLNQAISLNILDFIMFGCKEYQSSFSIREDKRHELFSDKLALYFFELRKITGKRIDPDDHKLLWLQLINAESEEELSKLENTNIPIIRKGVNAVYKLSNDEKVRELIRQREEAEALENSRLYNAERRGRADREAEIVSKLLASGMSENQIQKILNS